jgi:hypothetical protein
VATKGRIAEVKIFEVSFAVEGVDDDGEFFTDGATVPVIADSIEQCMEMVKEMRTLHGENILGIEGINLYADTLIVPENLSHL